MKPQLFLYIVGITALVGGFAQVMYTPILPQVQQELHTNHFLINLTVTLYTVTMAIMQSIIGPIVDQKGRKSVLLIGLIVFTTASLGCAFAHSVTQLLLLRIIQGIGGAVIPVVAIAVIGDLFEGKALIKSMGTFQLLLALSPALGPLIGGIIGGQWGMLGVFVFLGGAGLLLLIAVSAFLKETRPKSLEQKRFSLQGFVSVFQHRNGRALLRINFFQALSTMTLIVMLPGVFQRQFGMGAEGTGIAFLLMALSFMIAVRIGVSLQNKLGTARFFVYATWLNVCSYAFIGAASALSLSLLIIAFCIFGMTYGLSMPLPSTLISVWFQDHRGAANGALNIVRLMGTAAGPMVGTLLYMWQNNLVLFGSLMFMYGLSMWGSKQLMVKLYREKEVNEGVVY